MLMPFRSFAASQLAIPEGPQNKTTRPERRVMRILDYKFSDPRQLGGEMPLAVPPRLACFCSGARSDAPGASAGSAIPAATPTLKCPPRALRGRAIFGRFAIVGRYRGSVQKWIDSWTPTDWRLLFFSGVSS